MQAPVAIAILEGRTHTFTFANEPYLKLVDMQTVVGKPAAEALPLLKDQGVEKMLDGVFETGQPFHGTEMGLRLILSDNDNERFFNFVCTPKHDATEQVDGVLVTVTEVSEQVQARRKLEAFAHRLLQSEEKFRSVVEAAGAGTWDLDVATGAIESDARMNELMGFPKDVPFSLESSLELLPFESDKQLVRDSIAASFAGKDDGHYQVEFRTGGHSGIPLRWVESRAKPLLDGNGKPTRLAGTLVDITSRKLASDMAQRQTDFERQLIGIVSHDLNNPLTALLLAADMLERRSDLTEAVRSKIARIKSAGQRARRMIRDLLDFTKARLGGGLPVEIQKLDLHKLVDTAVAELQATHPNRFEVSHTGPGNGEWDADRLTQATQNLLNNAIKYGAADSPIKIESMGDPETVEIAVQNSGRPIASEKLETIFEPMQRASEESKQATRSVGLGLYIVKSIAEGHSGSVQVRSSEAEGTTFTIKLPRCAPRSDN